MQHKQFPEIYVENKNTGGLKNIISGDITYRYPEQLNDILCKSIWASSNSAYYRFSRDHARKDLPKLCHKYPHSAEIAASVISSENDDAKKAMSRLKYIIESHKPALQVAVKSAAYSNHIELMNQLIGKGASLDAALEGAMLAQNVVLYKELVIRGAENVTMNHRLRICSNIIQELKNCYDSSGCRLFLNRDGRIKHIMTECIQAKTEEEMIGILERATSVLSVAKTDRGKKDLLIRLKSQMISIDKAPGVRCSS